MKPLGGKRPIVQLVKRRDAAALLLLFVAVVFVLQNRGDATVRFLIPEVTAPLWTALLASVLLGVFLGVALAVRRSRPPGA
jgi:uncharacterized integral membrane protein